MVCNLAPHEVRGERQQITQHEMIEVLAASLGGIDIKVKEPTSKLVRRWGPNPLPILLKIEWLMAASRSIGSR
jgi:hypothetical protein